MPLGDSSNPSRSVPTCRIRNKSYQLCNHFLCVLPKPLFPDSLASPLALRRIGVSAVAQPHVHAHATQVTDIRDVNRCEDHPSKFGAQICSHVSSEKIPDAKAVAGKELEKLEKLPAWQFDEVKSKKDVILEEQREKKKVPFCYIEMDICHFKNAELEPKLQQCKGRVVPRGDIVKDDFSPRSFY